MAATIGLSVIKSIVCAYDVVTFPVYLLAQQPWKARRLSDRPRAKKVDPNDVYSPWISNELETRERHFIDECETIPDILSKAVEHYATRDCMGFRECFGQQDEVQPDGKKFKKLLLGEYSWSTYEEVQEKVDYIREGFAEAGIKHGNLVVIFSETRMEWNLAAQALFQLGAVIVTLYATLGEEGVVHGINECQATHVITSSELVPKLQSLADNLKHVKCTIYFDGPKKLAEDAKKKAQFNLINFESIEANGKQIINNLNKKKPSTLKRRKPNAGPEDTAIIMYTSGSTGVPKGVMITHRNLISSVKSFFSIATALNSKHQTYMSYLPLAHVLALVVEFFFLAYGASIGYSSPHTFSDESTAIKKGQRGDAVILKPTFLAAVPLILDRIRKGIAQKTESMGPFMAELLNFIVDYKKFWTRKGFTTPIINRVLCPRFKSAFGGRVELIACGGAPLSPETHEFIQAALNVNIIPGYGLTETCASATVMDMYDLDSCLAGAPLPGVKIRLVDWEEGNYRATDKPLPRGEIVIGGECITKGYFKQTEQTNECYRQENGERWFYTGDIGEMQTNGNLKIIDRKKDLVKLHHGEYISLTKVETELKGSEYVDNVCVYGDSFKNFLVALIAPNQKALKKLANSLSIKAKTMKEMCDNKILAKEVSDAIIEYAKTTGLSRSEIPTRYKLCPEEWMPDSGLVTAAMKIRRRNIQNFYQKDINNLYNNLK